MPQASSEITYTKLPAVFYERLKPAVFESASLLTLNNRLAEGIGLDLGNMDAGALTAILSGQSTLHGGDAIAMAYAGHQFGHWSGLLGDGRARLVGESKDSEGQEHEIHLKGAGATPFSRGGDGMATIGSAIREYIVSEAMAALGVPTTRALSIIETGEMVPRDTFQSGAIIARTARSHIRVGTFQFAAAFGSREEVQALADFAIDRLYPEAPASGPSRYAYFFRSVAEHQARLIAKWMLLGFIHGVMNTDNMCVSGETIDYGPCAFMDEFHPGKVFSSIDRNGRYAWNKQPEMAHWNLVMLAEALQPLFGEAEKDREIVVREAFDRFASEFEKNFNTGMAEKLGLASKAPQTGVLIRDCFSLLTEGKVDFTRFFTALALHAQGEPASIVLEEFSDRSLAEAWLERWRTEIGAGKQLSEGTVAQMRRSNPLVVPRNHRIEEAIAEANVGEFDSFYNLLKAVTAPYSDKPEFIQYQAPPLAEEVVTQTFCGT